MYMNLLMAEKLYARSGIKLFFFLVLGFELRAYILNNSTSPFFVIDFFRDKVS
jgi:hypothetical protein